MQKENEPSAEPKKAWYRDAMLMFSRLSIWIAIPVILASLLGNWLDEKYGTAPWILISAVGFSFVISMYGLIKESTNAFKKIEDEEAQKKKK